MGVISWYINQVITGGPILYAGGLCLGQGLRTGPFQRSQHALFAAHCTWEAWDDMGWPWTTHCLVRWPLHSRCWNEDFAIFHPSHIRWGFGLSVAFFRVGWNYQWTGVVARVLKGMSWQSSRKWIRKSMNRYFTNPLRCLLAMPL